MLPSSYLAYHYFFEIHQASSVLLNDLEFCTQILYQLANQTQLHVFQTSRQHFTPQGCSVLLLLAESHLSIHTWPEHQVALIDLLTCRLSLDPQVLLQILQQAFPTAILSQKKCPRGEFPRSPLELPP
jgi:S-adenosylmethionine decarboxylase